MGDTTAVYHVVCRDCRTEQVEQTERAAERAVERHCAAAGHRTVFEAFERLRPQQSVTD